MSKKQREKVEDEVRYHKEINSQQAQAQANANNALGIGRTPQASGNSTREPTRTPTTMTTTTAAALTTTTTTTTTM